MIRLAEEKDAQIILNIYKSMVGRPYCVWTNEYPCLDNITFDLEHNNLFVYELEGEIAGCISIEADNDLANLEEISVHDGNEIEISRVAIRVDLQGQGLARKMLSEFIVLMRKRRVSAIQLLVAKNNPIAQKTYASLGFIFKGETFMYDNDYITAELILEDISYREADTNDLTNLLKLYMELHDNPFPEDLTESKKIWEQMITDKNHHVIVAEVNGIIVSSVICVIIPNLTHGQRPYAFIENVITSKDYRGQGISSNCLAFAYSIAVSNNCYKMMLLTGSREEKTLNFYRNNGYNSNDKTAFIRWIK